MIAPARAFTDIDFGQLLSLAAGRPVADAACPWCGPTCSTTANRRRRVLRIWNDTPGLISFNCARCGEHGGISEGRALLSSDRDRIAQARELADRRHQAEVVRRGDIARFLWSQREPIAGTIAEKYLRDVRGYRGPLPGTIGFIQARGKHLPAVIAAFGVPVEVEPGRVQIANQAVHGVHLTRLKPDGSGKAGEPAKIMIGHSLGAPLVLAPPNDLLGLAITEGIEDGLSVHAATGLGAWAAGSASRLPALADAVPSWIDCITVIADNDPAGSKGSAELSHRLTARGIHTRVVSL